LPHPCMRWQSAAPAGSPVISLGINFPRVCYGGCMRRRQFITLLGGAAAWPLGVRAQQGGRVRRLAAMMGGRNADTDMEGHAWFAAFRTALEGLGWVEGRNFRADYRWSSGDMERMETIAKDFVEQKPDVIFAGNTPSVLALLRQTRTIPIVFTNL